MNKVKKAILFWFIIAVNIVCAQKPSGGKVIPLKTYDSIPVYKVSMDFLKLARKKAESKKLSEKIIYAYPVDVNIDIIQEGRLTVLNDGRKVWRYMIQSDGATSLSLIFSDYHLMRGSRLMIYSPDQSKVLGAFTEDNNKPFGTLAISPVASDKLVIELQAPREQKYPGKLVLGVIGHGFEKGNDETLDGFYGSSRDCNVDINCKSDTLYQTVKRAVCRIFYGSTGACTGTLINNTALDGEPYVITANHCFETEYLANNAVFHFNYESPYCEGPDGNYQSISGSELISTSKNLDFTLVRLSEIPDFNYNVYYAGWNVGGEITDSVFTIHHPRKDVKKISFSQDRPYIGNWGNGYDPYTHWIVEEYDYGTTEIFSSGASLFNKYGEITGVLSGGILDTCGYVYDNFQRLFNAYDDYADITQQLRHWINPLDYDIESLQGYDPYENFKLYGEYLTHFTPLSDTTLYMPEGGWGYLTGHNSDYSSSYAEKYEYNGNKYLLGAYIFPAKVSGYYDSSDIVFKVWDGTELPSDVVAEKRIYYYQMAENQPLFVQFDSSIFLKGSFFIGYDIFYNSPIDTFAMAASIINDTSDIHYVYKYENGTWQEINGYGTLSLAIFPLVYDYEKSLLKPFEDIDVDKVFIYPQPAHNEIYMFFEEDGIQEIKAELFDISGRFITGQFYSEPARNISFDLSSVKAGQYILRLKLDNNMVYRKVIVID